MTTRAHKKQLSTLFENRVLIVWKHDRLAYISIRGPPRQETHVPNLWKSFPVLFAYYYYSMYTRNTLGVPNLLTMPIQPRRYVSCDLYSSAEIPWRFAVNIQEARIYKKHFGRLVYSMPNVLESGVYWAFPIASHSGWQILYTSPPHWRTLKQEPIGIRHIIVIYWHGWSLQTYYFLFLVTNTSLIRYPIINAAGGTVWLLHWRQL